MAKSKTLHGARAVVWVGSTPIGIFNNIQYGVSYDLSPVFILGRLSAAELVYTGMEVINITASGFRVMDFGPFATVDNDSGASLVPKLQDVLQHEDIVLSVHDRSEPDPAKSLIMEVTNVKPQGFSTGNGARTLQEMTVTFLGLHLSDESGPNNEDPTAADLPQGSN